MLLGFQHICAQLVEVDWRYQQFCPKISCVVPVISVDVTIIFWPRKARIPGVFSARSRDPNKL